MVAGGRQPRSLRFSDDRRSLVRLDRHGSGTGRQQRRHVSVLYGPVAHRRFRQHDHSRKPGLRTVRPLRSGITRTALRSIDACSFVYRTHPRMSQRHSGMSFYGSESFSHSYIFRSEPGPTRPFARAAPRFPDSGSESSRSSIRFRADAAPETAPMNRYMPSTDDLYCLFERPFRQTVTTRRESRSSPDRLSIDYRINSCNFATSR